MTLNKTPERFLWATNVFNLDPSDHILEIGCGAGLLAEQISGRLKSGKLFGIDQSAFMIARAKKRNDVHIRSGRAEFIHATFAKSDFASGLFNGIVAFKVNFFQKHTVSEFDIIQRIMKRDGKLFVFYQAPYERDVESTDVIQNNLYSHSFQVCDVIMKKLQPAPVFCIIASLG